MAFDAHSNFGYSNVAVAPFPSNSGTSLQVAAGQGALFPAAPFNCTVWPAGVLPLASNAEIVRVTAVVGDTLTIVRAQEGTAAIAIEVGMQIANTTSVKVFTDIQDAIAISAGTQQASGPFTFANSNGVTFGMDAGTVTASVNTGAGAMAISAGGNSQSTGTVIFANSNGITFGLDGAGNLTASHNGLTSQSNQAFSADGGSSAFQTLSFANSNGLTFSNSNGSVVASYTVPSVAGLLSNINLSAGTTSNNGSAFTFADANGVTFGLNNGTITASVAAGVAPGSISAGTQTFGLGQAILSNANGITFGMDNGTITASHNGLTSQSNQAASASNGSFTFQTINFSDANGVTFGTSAGGIITASVNTAGGGGGLLRSFEPRPPVSTNSAVIAVDNLMLAPFVLPMSMSLSYVRNLFSMQTRSTTFATLASASLTASWAHVLSVTAMLYTMGTGASSNSMFLISSSSDQMRFIDSLSVTNSSQQSITQAFTYFTGGATSEFSTAYATTLGSYAFSTTAFSAFTGSRFVDVPFALSMSAGNYWIGMKFASSSTSNAALAGPFCFIQPNSNVFVQGLDDNFAYSMGGTNTNGAAFLFGGVFSTTLGTTSVIANTAITRGGSNRVQYFELIA